MAFNKAIFVRGLINFYKVRVRLFIKERKPDSANIMLNLPLNFNIECFYFLAAEVAPPSPDLFVPLLPIGSVLGSLCPLPL